MKDFVKRMVIEHKELVARIEKLHNNVYNLAANTDDKVEYANKAIQLAAMKKYEEALRARLENQGIGFNGADYVEVVRFDNKEDGPAK